MRTLILLLTSFLVMEFAKAQNCISQDEHISSLKSEGWTLSAEEEMSFTNTSNLKDRVLIFKKETKLKLSVYLSCKNGFLRKIASNDTIINTKKDENIDSRFDKFIFSPNYLKNTFTITELISISSDWAREANRQIQFSYDHQKNSLVVSGFSYSESARQCGFDPNLQRSYEYIFRPGSYYATQVQKKSTGECVGPEFDGAYTSKLKTSEKHLCMRKEEVNKWVMPFESITSVGLYMDTVMQTIDDLEKVELKKNPTNPEFINLFPCD